MHATLNATSPAQELVIKPVPVDLILDLRHRVLRAGLPREAARFSGDDRTSTWHFALVDNSAPDKPVLACCASFMFEHFKYELAWRLRGMATEPSLQGRGFGQKLLLTAEQMVAEDSKVRTFWCDARIAAVPFYAKNRWQVASSIFNIQGAGPHRKMIKRLGDPAPTKRLVV